MSQVDRLLWWFRMKRRATLGEILASGEAFAYEWRARKTELNAKGGPQIVLAERHRDKPSMNVYELRETGPEGQFEMAI